MNIWTSKAGYAALTAILIAGCATDGASPALAFGDAGVGGFLAPRAPQEQAEMLGGAITLIPPDGFCVDARSRRSDFAMMARCDVLGAELTSQIAVPLAIMTASVAPISSDTEFQAVVLQDRTQRVLDRYDVDGMYLTRFSDTPPDETLSRDFWRGVTRIGDTMVSIGLYSSVNAPALGPYGRVMLEESLTFTRQASLAGPQ